MSRYQVLRKIESLDPIEDHQQIVFLSTRFDFPFDTTRALEFALFRTFCVPNVSRILAQTGEFLHRPQKRYDDTDIIVSELMEWGYESSRGRRALRRMNQIHSRFPIENYDYLYVLSTFIFEPIRWNMRFGWRPLCEVERQAYYRFWKEVGRRMNIREIPNSLEAYEQFNVDYERQNFQFCDSNQRIGNATRELFASWAPRAFAPAVRATITAMLDEPLLKSFGFTPTPRWLGWCVRSALQLRAKVIRWLPARDEPHLRTEQKYRSYVGGYQIESLGPS